MIRNLHVPLFLLAFAIALVIKFTVYEQATLSERVVEAQVTYGAPSAGIVSYDRLETVKVAVRGPANDISQLSVFTVEVKATIPEGRAGATEIVLDTNDVQFNIPGTFEVLSVEPNRFTIRVEPRAEAFVPIRVQLYGEPSAGAHHGEPTVRPAQVKISGPRSRVEPLEDLTALVSLDGHARTFSETVSLTPPDPLVQVVEPTVVTVTVP
ncbi:MAG: YbbR-like domain-containing protein, partial [Acidobacteriota bacterium]